MDDFLSVACEAARAAGALIVEEAGGKVTDFSGKPWGMESKTFLASNRVIHEKLLETVK